ncbi:MAG: hypothetical protein KatS3mg114_0566 [Planctomycetaceae bacterium]|nr:MAG: hypothetical protein KatS3mg114_0566 [Planctomycetaceae bacterium]
MNQWMLPSWLIVAQHAGDTSSTMSMITIFVLAMFVGFEIITKIPPTLHTPLMSGSNAISGITIIGALVAAGHLETGAISRVLATLAVALATVNVVGGFLVTHRMLNMFRSGSDRQQRESTQEATR